MCHIRASYQKADELLSDLSRCSISCPSAGSLLKSFAECAIYQRSLRRYAELLEREGMEVKKEKERGRVKESPPVEIQVEA
jgi:hypothetical protein